MHHNHWVTPFDFSEVQMSVWLALIPATIYLWLNFSILKMDNTEEYYYFKEERGIRKLRTLAGVSILLLVGYLIFAMV